VRGGENEDVQEVSTSVVVVVDSGVGAVERALTVETEVVVDVYKVVVTSIQSQHIGHTLHMGRGCQTYPWW